MCNVYITKKNVYRKIRLHDNADILFRKYHHARLICIFPANL